MDVRGKAAGIASGERRSLVTALEIAAGYYGGSHEYVRRPFSPEVSIAFSPSEAFWNTDLFLLCPSI